MEKIIVFGGTSKVGIKLTNLLSKKKDFEIFAVGKTTKYNDYLNVKYLYGDIRDLSFYNTLPQSDVFAIYNLAGVQPSILPYSEHENHHQATLDYLSTNILGLSNILEYAVRVKTKKYIYTSTHRELEGYWNSSFLIKRDLDQKINFKGDHSVYAISKHAGILLGNYYHEKFGLNIASFRLPMIFMVGQSDKYLVNGQEKTMPYLDIIKQAILGKPLEIWGDPQMKRDYVHVQNLLYLLEKSLEVNFRNEVFNVGTSEGASTENFVTTIGKHFSKNPNQIYVYKPEKITYKSAVYDISKEVEFFNYKPILLDEMIRLLKEEINDNNLINIWKWLDNEK
jgi:UDP-glucose 4-epimerase